jgi:hypothetical protein
MDLSKIKNRIISINYVLIVMLSYVIRCLVYGASYQDTIIIAVLAFLYGLVEVSKQYFNTKEKFLTENEFRVAVNKDMSDIKNKLANVALQVTGNPFNRK